MVADRRACEGEVRVRYREALAALLVCIGAVALAGEPYSGEPAAAEAQRPATEVDNHLELPQLPAGLLQGTVTDPGRRPHQDRVRLALGDPETGRVVASVFTSAGGRYSLGPVPSGRYVFSAGEPGLSALVELTEEAEPGRLDVIVPATSLASALSGDRGSARAAPLAAVMVPDEEGAVLVAALGSPTGPPGHPDVPPGPPGWVPGPPPWISPTKP